MDPDRIAEISFLKSVVQDSLTKAKIALGPAEVASAKMASEYPDTCRDVQLALKALTRALEENK